MIINLVLEGKLIVWKTLSWKSLLEKEIFLPLPFPLFKTCLTGFLICFSRRLYSTTRKESFPLFYTGKKFLPFEPSLVFYESIGNYIFLSFTKTKIHIVLIKISENRGKLNRFIVFNVFKLLSRTSLFLRFGTVKKDFFFP